MKKKLLDKFDLFFTTFGYVGLLPKMPGTFGSAAALLFLLIPEYYRIYWLLPLFVVFFVYSFWAIKRVEEKHEVEDPGMIVIDEVLGMMLIFMLPFIRYDWLFGGLAFVLFRVFDIVKPFPINLLNNKKGAFFVIADDLIAAIYAWMVLWLIYKAASILGFLILLGEVAG
jgi:phosphatidylglycerophosphatase A